MITPIVYIVLAALLSGSIVGYQAKSILVDAEQASILKAEREKLLKFKKINSDLRDELIIANAEAKIIYKTIIKKVPEYVTVVQKTDSQCNITHGVKRLLNEIINPMSRTTAGIVDTDRGYSDIRTSDLINYTAKTIKQYKLTQVRCNLLIKWHHNNDSK